MKKKDKNSIEYSEKHLSQKLINLETAEKILVHFGRNLPKRKRKGSKKK